MAEWNLYGTERKEVFERELEPKNLGYSLKAYQKELGKDFTIHDMIRLEEIKALGNIAEAINDLPEFFVDQVGKARQDISFHSIGTALEAVAEAISEAR